MRLSDEQKLAEEPDEQTGKVLDYLKAENAYLKASMQHTEALQKQLVEEMVGRIKQDEESVPYFENGYWYYARFAEGKEYPLHCRKKGSLESECGRVFEALRELLQWAANGAQKATKGIRAVVYERGAPCRDETDTITGGGFLVRFGCGESVGSGDGFLTFFFSLA